MVVLKTVVSGAVELCCVILTGVFNILSAVSVKVDKKFKNKSQYNNSVTVVLLFLANYPNIIQTALFSQWKHGRTDQK